MKDQRMVLESAALKFLLCVLKKKSFQYSSLLGLIFFVSDM